MRAITYTRLRDPFNLDVRRNMGLNARYQFVLLYTVGWDRIVAAAADVNQAIEDGALRVGEQAGLPLHRYRLEDAAAALRCRRERGGRQGADHGRGKLKHGQRGSATPKRRAPIQVGLC